MRLPYIYLRSFLTDNQPTKPNPFPRSLESLSICRCHYKGSTFFLVISRPCVLVRPRFESATSCQQPGTHIDSSLFSISLVVAVTFGSMKLLVAKQLSCTKSSSFLFCLMHVLYLYTCISVWICKNMATEISLTYPLTESCSGAGFFKFFFLS